MLKEILMIIIRWFIPFACAGGFAFVLKELKENKKANEAMKSAMLSIIRGQIVNDSKGYLKQGFMSRDERYCLEQLLNNYKALGGNHGIELLVDKCLQLPVE